MKVIKLNDGCYYKLVKFFRLNSPGDTVEKIRRLYKCTCACYSGWKQHDHFSFAALPFLSVGNIVVI